MDTAATWTSDPYPRSDLEIFIENNNAGGFGDEFLYLANATTTGQDDNLKYKATIFTRNITTGEVHSIPFGGSEYYRENAVVVTRWVNIDETHSLTDQDTDSRDQTVLLEVVLWRA